MGIILSPYRFKKSKLAFTSVVFEKKKWGQWELYEPALLLRALSTFGCGGPKLWGTGERISLLKTGAKLIPIVKPNHSPLHHVKEHPTIPKSFPFSSVSRLKKKNKTEILIMKLKKTEFILRGRGQKWPKTCFRNTWMSQVWAQFVFFFFWINNGSFRRILNIFSSI